MGATISDVPTICISLALPCTGARRNTEGCWLRWIIPVVVRPHRRRSGTAAPAPWLKSGGWRAGATVWGVFGTRRTEEKLGADLFLPGVLPAAASVESIMANKAQQPPYLHLAEVTASQFLDIWKHFDTDGRSLFSPFKALYLGSITSIVFKWPFEKKHYVSWAEKWDAPSFRNSS